MKYADGPSIEVETLINKDWPNPAQVAAWPLQVSDSHVPSSF